MCERCDFIAARGSKADVEEGDRLMPAFDANGLLTCVTTDAATGEVLMVAHMNAEALARTVETGEAWYWSRSRASLWHKGDTSGQIQTVVEMRVDCDQDAIVLKVEVGGDGGCCHTGRRSCFYRRVITEPDGRGRLVFDDAA
ncbi:phosphoribosyl-AMP cyclohydrolase [Chelatococcus daeguensis]|uniref:Phosphoribosyl-AMP cyclohydrolase n=2 Tax=Chelatococcus TaxID=28209 RepID=A0AAC9JQH2_9HYPH|nr:MULTISPECIES: phosphoribosyl-AMP cyclohydrolase [Chelatococcus]APF37903.1 phosphoribosyl-AMP cyclohydrolase [Chelatococcus daeguensis]KZE28399.1 phosphoribosyl-AMP cyclohydrolase [Chelatococcus daeguensis]MBM3083348.1 phosphoribosyl-AMP cyclohydrolase [Chelatococcus daeguensis]CUA83758.1 phosphoribosyl-AMP cyclohydrolase [Chelatococcus sambhunathii]